MLTVENINVYYGKIHAIRDVSFTVGQGEIVALIGANGAGKSTTLKTVSGMLRSRGGSITFLGEDISRTESYRLLGKGLAHVPEGRRIFLQMTVLENLEMGAYIHGKPASAELERIFTLFPRLGERKDQVAGTLSGGEQQMLAMGRALISSPKLLMLDEPSMGLSPILVQQIFDIVEALHREGVTILLVEQNADMALQLADRAYVLESGKVTLTGTGGELIASDAIRSAYLGG
jgi:branched-chain amino acid transport system ATP-binding protein